jgi:hypothetical protein
MTQKKAPHVDTVTISGHGCDERPHQKKCDPHLQNKHINTSLLQRPPYSLPGHLQLENLSVRERDVRILRLVGVGVVLGGGGFGNALGALAIRWLAV